MDAVDVAIIGSGPAALGAAIYLGRAGLKVQVFERANIGGELENIAHIANYPGFVGTGKELAKIMREQAEAAGAKLNYGEVVSLSLMSSRGCAEATAADSSIREKRKLAFISEDAQNREAFAESRCHEAREARNDGPERRVPREGGKLKLLVDNTPVLAKRVLVATGSEPVPLGFPLDVPVSYCALCDIDLIPGKNVAVVGGGNSAFQEAQHLAEVAGHLTIISHSAPKAEATLQEKLKALPNVELRIAEPDAALLNQFDHVFVFIGKRPATDFLQNVNSESSESSAKVKPGIRDEHGHIIGQNGTHQTIIPEIYAAGSVRQGVLSQVITSVSDGVLAAIEIINDLKK